jgi:hypothetical protein
MNTIVWKPRKSDKNYILFQLEIGQKNFFTKLNTYKNMRDPEDEDSPDYGPNRLAELSRTDPEKYRRIVNHHLDKNDTIEQWQQRNLERAKDDLARQRLS